MNYSHPIWEGHQYNNYKTNKNCFNNTIKEEKNIRALHKSEENTKNLNEWIARPMGGLNSSLGKLDIPKNNHGLANDRYGLVVNHIGDVNKLVKNESFTEVVQDIKKWSR